MKISTIKIHDLPPHVTAEFLQQQHLSRDFPNRFWAKVKKTEHCWLWTAHIKTVGYGQIARGLPFSGSIGAHVAIWLLTYGSIPEDQCVLHDCRPLPDNRACCNPNHLWLGTLGDNNRDTIKKVGYSGPFGSGEKSIMSKLTWVKVREIRRLIARGYMTTDIIGSQFGVCAALISLIAHNKRWPIERDPLNQKSAP